MRWIVITLGVAMLVGLWGCGKASVTIPDNYGIPGGSPPPPATIVRADANSHADLVRENQQLRARVAWLENQNRRSSGKYESLAKEEDEIRADMKKIAAERDRYRKEAGQ